MPAQITVLYPAGTNFNMDYYMNTHMPLVMDIWGSEGLTGYSVSKFIGTAAGGDSPHSVQAILEFESIDRFQTTIKGEGTSKVMGDVPNFS